MCEERSIINEFVHICGDCATEYLSRELRSESFQAFLDEMREGQPIMNMTLVRTSDLFETNPGCAFCWQACGRNEPGRWTLDLMIDGDA